jgi:hypothetical protein
VRNAHRGRIDKSQIYCDRLHRSMEQRCEEDLVSLASVDVMLCFHSRSSPLFERGVFLSASAIIPSYGTTVSFIQLSLRFSPGGLVFSVKPSSGPNGKIRSCLHKEVWFSPKEQNRNGFEPEQPWEHEGKVKQNRSSQPTPHRLPFMESAVPRSTKAAIVASLDLRARRYSFA